ncbi:6-phospho-beta-glucosidase [Nakamurella sp. YIM 132087]|uniref:6-phospho-beta-glucosidase n=1 Tax=Nakamurella alba TaxID=2665158 RepID=A0A7K1FG47_9ACTN|nr:6-phospho-beta-glucosidase [Nakamurella alba]MTD13040.1 6-phospho-beta-glucosidase [Nakamurella alba]
MKIVVVGGGSTYTPELIDGMARLRTELPVDEIVLVDPAEDRRELLAAVSRRMLRKLDHPARVSTTADPAQAADGAAAVLLQLRVGGQAARARDERWPLDCGCVGQETTGAGGLAKALRTVPVVTEIADTVRDVNPDAWIVDFTNPVGIVTRALLQEGHRAVGLCNVAIGLQRYFAELLGTEPGRVELDHVGLNHLTWERRVLLDGEDVLPGLLAGHGDAIAARIGLPVALLRELGVVPSYYLRYFYLHDQVVREQRGTGSRAEEVAAMEKQLLEMYADPTIDSKPDLLAGRGGAHYSDAAVALMASLLGDRRDVQVANVRNSGTLPFLPDDAVIEVPSTIGADGATPLPVASVPPLFTGLIGAVTAYEHLALEAAVHGGADRVRAALLAHPLVGQWDLAESLTERLLAENRRYLSWAG